MTDRLTPGMLRDLGALWDDYTSGSAEKFGKYLSEIAARREAEAPCRTCNDDPAVCADVPNLRHCEKATREGPGSADAPRSTRVHLTAEDFIAKPAPAADDLVERLRRTVFYEGHGERTDAAEEAADRIEAQAREIANLTAMHAAKQAAGEALKARVARLADLLKEATDNHPLDYMLRVKISAALATKEAQRHE